jgi:dihydrofolate synthase/folylpolyglutamate synthase
MSMRARCVAALLGGVFAFAVGSASYGQANLIDNPSFETLNDTAGLGIAEAVVKKGVADVKWPGRFQVLREDPPTILDGAHNPGGAEALADTLNQVFKNKPIALVFGICDDKDIRNYLKPFGKLVKRMWAVPLKTERSLPVGQVAAAGKGMGWPVVESNVQEAMTESLGWAKQNGGAVCIAGSLFLVGELLSPCSPYYNPGLCSFPEKN